MNPDNLIIEDFDFSRYPIIRIYPLGGKTVIQINPPFSLEKTQDLIDDLERSVSGLEEEISDLKDKNEALETKKDELNKELDESLDLLEEIFDFTPNFSGTMQENLWALKDFLNNKARSDAEWEDLEEELRELQVDNRALASTITDQNEIIADLEKQLDAFRNVD